MGEPKNKRGASRQDYSTPRDFLDRFPFGATLDLDLAADASNAKAPRYYTAEQDGLTQPWDGKLMWLNPPFGNIAPWLARAAKYAPRGGTRSVFVLVPASVGSNWFRDRVAGKAAVYLLNGRLTFEGCTSPFPKDCMLLWYGVAPGVYLWDWRNQSMSEVGPL